MKGKHPITSSCKSTVLAIDEAFYWKFVMSFRLSLHYEVPLQWKILPYNQGKAHQMIKPCNQFKNNPIYTIIYIHNLECVKAVQSPAGCPGWLQFPWQWLALEAEVEPSPHWPAPTALRAAGWHPSPPRLPPTPPRSDLLSRSPAVRQDGWWWVKREEGKKRMGATWRKEMERAEFDGWLSFIREPPGA